MQRKQIKGGLLFAILRNLLKETSMESCSAFLKEPLCIFGSPELVLPGS